MIVIKYFNPLFAYFLMLSLALPNTTNLDKSAKLVQAYPDYIKTITKDSLVWHDTTLMPLHERANTDSVADSTGLLENPTLYEQIYQDSYLPGLPLNISSYVPYEDSGRLRYEPFFRKMYGNSPEEVESHLVEIAWMPKIFGDTTYKLLVTTINNVHEKIQAISRELELLVQEKPEFKKFLDNPGGTYTWRTIANTDRLSNHSFGMTIDINTEYSHYWQWDLEKAGLPIDENTVLEYTNLIPWEIVLIFEKYGFVWGGKWYHYDTMHFEYRPELFEYFYV